VRIRLDSVGCRLNLGEIDSLGRTFAAAGHRIVGPGDAVDLVVFNTCAVTQAAGRKSRHVVRQLKRAHPTASFVVTGCYATLEPETTAALDVDLVVDNAGKDDLPRLLAAAGLLRDADPIPAVEASPIAAPEFDRTRAFVKVQDGCENRCTFCIVTVARGQGRSSSQPHVIAELNELVEAGYQEAVLSGVHLGSFGHERGNAKGLQQLVQMILAETDLPRLRLSSLEPWDLDAEFFSLWKEPRLLPHLHLPLQSGCDATLQRMARRTDQKRFSTLMRQARAAIPDVSITTDVIVGFPGETDAEFEDSIAFIEAMNFARLHIFRYSRREGTAAANMPNQVPADVMQARSKRMHALGAELERNFQDLFVGTTQSVLWEQSEPFGLGQRWSGLTGNYLRVVTETSADVDLKNRITDVELIEVLPGAIVASVSDLEQNCCGAELQYYLSILAP